MSVFIHPSDSGPISTRNRTSCNNCNESYYYKGNRAYKHEHRQPKHRRSYSHTKYHNLVCPHCHSSQNNTSAIKCPNCKHEFPATAAKKKLDRSEPSQCPECNTNINEDHIID